MAGSAGDGGRWLPDGPRDGPTGRRGRRSDRSDDQGGRSDPPSRQGEPGRSDIAEFLSGGLTAGLTILILGLLGLIYVFSESGPSEGTNVSETVRSSEAVTATRVNGAAGSATDGDGAGGTRDGGQDIDGDGDAGAGERPPAGGDLAGTAGRDVDGDGDTARDRESQVDPGAGDAVPAPDGSAAEPGAAASPGTAASDPTAPADGASERDPDGGAADERSEPAVAVLPGPGDRSSEQQTARPVDDAASEPSPQDRPSVATTGAADSPAEMPDRDGGPGLFSADDPQRQVATIPDMRPRDERVLHADLDGDGEKERVWAAVVADQVLTRVERVIDGAWTPVSEHTGAVADRLVALRAHDLTGDGRPEIRTRQWVGTEGESITLWSYGDDSLQRMPVTGGCADGSNTVGLVGALVRVPGSDRPGLVAVCRDPDLPPQQWPSGLYEWRDGTWSFVRLYGEMP
jgi:hypothetical protein